MGFGVGEPPPGHGGGCTPSVFGLKAGPEVGEPPGGNKNFLPLAIAIELGLGVGLPPGDGGGCTPSVSGPKTDPEVGEPPGNGQTSLLPDGSGRVSFLAIGIWTYIDLGAVFAMTYLQNCTNLI